MEYDHGTSELTLEGLELLLDDGEAGIKDFDAANYLTNPESIATYLTEMLRAGDDGMIAEALGEVARSIGMSKVAEMSGIGREALYKALREGAQPRLRTVNEVIKACGMRLVVVKAYDEELANYQNHPSFKHADTVTPARAEFHLKGFCRVVDQTTEFSLERHCAPQTGQTIPVSAKNCRANDIASALSISN